MAQQKKELSNGFISFNPLKMETNEQILKGEQYYELMNKRRSIRNFSSKQIPDGLLEKVIQTASTAPSGAHKQPWMFCVVKSPDLKKKIRAAAEKEEYENYNGRMSEEWKKDLEKFDTNWEKPFLEIAPALIIVFKKTYDLIDGDKQKNYYVNESVGLACGFLLSAIHHAGLVSLTHTPSPLNFLSKILKRPVNEKPFLLIPVGYPENDCKVPLLKRKELNEIMFEY
tara:strand:+ start:378 stop:1058 length:681 start_codon:yes stop_codon:yes gene_type:complete